MVRGFVYSILSIALFFLANIAWMASRSLDEDTLAYLSGWLILISFFGIGPVFFALGYWHNLRLHPKEPHWDPETGE